MAQADNDSNTSNEPSNAVPICSVNPKQGGGPRDPRTTIRDRLDLQDILSARLTQMEGLLGALRNSYDEDEQGFRVPAEHMRNALWALNELRSQAQNAYHNLSKLLAPAAGV